MIETAYIDPISGDIGTHGQIIGLDDNDQPSFTLDGKTGEASVNQLTSLLKTILQGLATYNGNEIATVDMINNLVKLDQDNTFTANNTFKGTGVNIMSIAANIMTDILYISGKNSFVIDATNGLTINALTTFNNMKRPVIYGKGTPNSYDAATMQDIAKLAPIDSPFFAGNPQAPTPLFNDQSDSIATTKFASWMIDVDNKFAIAPGGLCIQWDTTTILANTTSLELPLTVTLDVGFGCTDGITQSQANASSIGVVLSNSLNSVILSNASNVDITTTWFAFGYVTQLNMNWSQSNIVTGNSYIVSFLNDKFFARNAYYIYYSTDGINWLPTNVPGSSNYTQITYYNGLYLCGGYNNNTLYYSTDGINWLPTNLTIGDFAISYSDNIWIASEISNGLGLYYSTDGINWSPSNISSGKYYLSEYANNIFIANDIGNERTGLLYSTDGKTWIQSNLTSGNFDIPKYNGIWVVGDDGSESSGIWYSTDGKTWIQSNITSGDVSQISYGDNTWVTFDTNALFYYSYDGMYWNQTETTGLDSAYQLCYADGTWATLSSRTVSYSKDGGKTWKQANAEQGSYYGINYANGIWFLCDTYYGQGLWYSYDCINWIKVKFTGPAYFTNVVYGNNIWVSGCGDRGNAGLWYSKGIK